MTYDSLNEDLYTIFEGNFLANAPLYQESKKVKIPFEDAKKETVLYRGSLIEQVRPVDTIADFRMFTGAVPANNEIRHLAGELGKTAGIVTDGLIRLENVRHNPDGDPRNLEVRVADILEHADGRKNLQVFFVDTSKEPWNPADPMKTIAGWIAYRFYFAAANVRTEYKASKAAPHNTPTK